MRSPRSMRSSTSPPTRWWARSSRGPQPGRSRKRIFGDPGTRFDPAYWDATIAAAPRIRFGRAPWAYVKIAEGCDRGCTFCAIPLMRGKFRSRTIETIEAEARSLAAAGVSELSLVSQDSVMWGRDTGEGDFVSLLERLEKVDGIERMRLMYLHPQGVTDELIDKISSSDKIASYFDLSLQHVAPSVLKGMGRWGGRDRFDEDGGTHQGPRRAGGGARHFHRRLPRRDRRRRARGRVVHRGHRPRLDRRLHVLARGRHPLARHGGTGTGVDGARAGRPVEPGGRADDGPARREARRPDPGRSGGAPRYRVGGLDRTLPP